MRTLRLLTDRVLPRSMTYFAVRLNGAAPYTVAYCRQQWVGWIRAHLRNVGTGPFEVKVSAATSMASSRQEVRYSSPIAKFVKGLDEQDKRMLRMVKMIMGVPMVLWFGRGPLKLEFGVVPGCKAWDVGITAEFPPEVMNSPASMHLFMGLMRTAIGCYSLDYEDAFIPAATLKELNTALAGDRELARRIFDKITPNLLMSTEQFGWFSDINGFNFVAERGPENVFPPFNDAWAIDYYNMMSQSPYGAGQQWESGMRHAIRVDVRPDFLRAING